MICELLVVYLFTKKISMISNKGKRKQRVKFMKECITDEDGIKTFELGHKDVDSCFIKQYVGAMSSLFSLSACARNLLDYLAYTMNADNIVMMNSYSRDDFNRNFKDGGYSLSSITKATAELVDNEFLKQKQRGVYLVNPEFFDNGKAGERLNKIQVLLEFERGVRPSMVVSKKFEKLS